MTEAFLKSFTIVTDLHNSQLTEIHFLQNSAFKNIFCGTIV